MSADRQLFAHYSAGPSGPFATVAVPSRDKPLWWQTQGLSWSASGYGGRIPTRMQVQINGRWRRVYCACYSNAGTCYVEDRSQPKRIPEGGKIPRYPWIIIRD